MQSHARPNIRERICYWNESVVRSVSCRGEWQRLIRPHSCRAVVQCDLDPTLVNVAHGRVAGGRRIVHVEKRWVVYVFFHVYTVSYCFKTGGSEVVRHEVLGLFSDTMSFGGYKYYGQYRTISIRFIMLRAFSWLQQLWRRYIVTSMTS